MRVVADFIGKIDSRGAELRGFAVGPLGELCVLLAAKSGSPRWRVPCFANDAEWEFEIEDGGATFHHAQPMPEGILLCNARQSGQYSNARIYDSSGAPLRDLSLGDGIADLQATSAGDIWAAYYDEGIFGSTIGSAGLARFDAHGRQMFKFQPNAKLDWISDCYALNVAGPDQVWFYYYTPFPLVRLRRDVIDGIWSPGVQGSRALAVLGDRVVMHSGYGKQDWRLLRLCKDGSVDDLGTIDFITEDGESLPAREARARSRYLWFVHDASVYRADIGEIERNLA